MKTRIILAALATVLGLALSLPVPAHDDTKGSKKESHQGHGDDHASSIGEPGDPAMVTRNIEVEMSDAMRFKPENIAVKRGETIKFMVKNAGKVKHEMVLGSMKELKAHAEMMRKMPEMQHADPNMVTVDPGKTGEMVWRFSKAGTFDFACLQPGHFEAGMKGKVNVSR